MIDSIENKEMHRLEYRDKKRAQINIRRAKEKCYINRED